MCGSPEQSDSLTFELTFSKYLFGILGAKVAGMEEEDA